MYKITPASELKNLAFDSIVDGFCKYLNIKIHERAMSGHLNLQFPSMYHVVLFNYGINDVAIPVGNMRELYAKGYEPVDFSNYEKAVKERLLNAGYKIELIKSNRYPYNSREYITWFR